MDIIILGIITFLFGKALKNVYKNSKNGLGCEGCALKDSCHKNTCDFVAEYKKDQNLKKAKD